MITRLLGSLNRVLEDRVRLQVGPIEYEVLVAEFVRRQIQTQLGQEVALHTSHYFEGNPMQGRMAPRLIGFLQEPELEFFDLFCTVDKVGVRKALKMLVRPVREIADAIQRQDVKWLTTLPGVGPSTAEQIVATLRKKVTKFALMPGLAESPASPASDTGAQLIEDGYQALLSVGHSPAEARERLDRALSGGKNYASVEDLLVAIYKAQ